MKNNSLQGNIPQFAASFVTIDLSYNSFTDFVNNTAVTLPPTTVHLDLSHNQLSAFPKFAPNNLTNVQHLDLSSNRISGSFPEPSTDPNNAWSHMEALVYFNISNNPLAVARLPGSKYLSKNTLQIMDFSNCSLIGTINGNFKDYTALTTLILNQNGDLTGPLPNFKPTKLNYLDLSNTGVIDKLYPMLEGVPADVNGTCFLFNTRLECDIKTVNRSKCCANLYSPTTTTTTTAATTTSGTTSVSRVCNSNIIDQYPTAFCEDGTWFVNGTVVVIDDSLNIGDKNQIVIQGNYIQAGTSVLQIDKSVDSYNQPSITTSGDSILNGTLIINVGSVSGTTLNVTIISGTNITGQFSGIEVHSDSSARCKIKATPKYTGTNVLVELSQASSCSNNRNKTIIIAVATSIGALILIIVIVIIIVLILKRSGKLSLNGESSAGLAGVGSFKD